MLWVDNFILPNKLLKSGEDIGAAVTVTYAYDDLNRIKEASSTQASYGGNYTYNYNYGTLGNILSRTENSTTTNYTYATSTSAYYDSVAAIHIGNSTSTFDSNGNILTEGSKSYTWDYDNRLTQSVVNNATTTYAYDYSDQRVKQTTPSGTTIYASKYYNTNGTTPTKNIFLPDGTLIATVVGTGTSTTVSYIHPDHLGGMNVATDDSGNVVELSDYYPYGNSRIDEQNGLNSQRKFANYEADSTGLDYLNARYYDPTTARFISQDPVFLAMGDNEQIKQLTGKSLQELLADPQSLNPYSYAKNNPLLYTDPNGQLAYADILPPSITFTPVLPSIGAIATSPELAIVGGAAATAGVLVVGGEWALSGPDSIGNQTTPTTLLQMPDSVSQAYKDRPPTYDPRKQQIPNVFNPSTADETNLFPNGVPPNMPSWKKAILIGAGASAVARYIMGLEDTPSGQESQNPQNNNTNNTSNKSQNNQQKVFIGPIKPNDKH